MQKASVTMMTTPTITVPPYMQNRELSWLEFNKRVLDQGSDPNVPLLDRLNFVSIFWSNLQEFFMVRVGSLTDLSLVKKSIIDLKSGMTPAQQLDAIYKRCHELYPYYQFIYEDIRQELAAEGVENLRVEDLDQEQLEYLDGYVRANVAPFLSPQIVNSRHPFPHLENGGLYVVVRLDETHPVKDAGRDGKAGKDKDGKGKAGKDSKDSKAAKNLGAEGVTLGLIPLPRQCERVIKLPGKGLKFVLLEHALEHYAPMVFSMYKVKHTNIICVTRNADLDATESTDEIDDDYREHMKRILKKRSRLAPVRLESERPLSSTVKRMLLDKLNLKDHQSFVTSVPLNMSYTWGLASMCSPKRKATLTQPPFTPQWPACLERTRPVMDQVAEKEVLLSYPYESMDAFVQLLREAAVDPSVISIKITLYRLASQSHLAEALIAAAENGKDVTALFELRARFDESNNIQWSQRFEEAGCHVIYGFRNFKVHSKICTITRQTPQGLQYITQLGTGNYNEKTAKLYTDYSFITTDQEIGKDAARFFRNMALENTSDQYSKLWVAPLQIKQNIMVCIDQQIALAREGKPSGVVFKTNSVTDAEIITKIAEASQAGVPCILLVRGISCLLPGVEGFTDNVRVVSIVGRLLEHSRIYCFGPENDCQIYLSSADLMTRNMNKRIEIAWPILDPQLRDDVVEYIKTCLSDTAKLRELKADGTYTPLYHFAGAGASAGADGAAAAGASDPANAGSDGAAGDAGPFDSQNFLIEKAANPASTALPGEGYKVILRSIAESAAAATATPAADSVAAKPEVETKPEMEPMPEPELDFDPSPTPEPNPTPTREPEPELEPEPESESEPAPAPESESGPAPAPEPEPQPRRADAPQIEVIQEAVNVHGADSPHAQVIAKMPAKPNLGSTAKKAAGFAGTALLGVAKLAGTAAVGAAKLATGATKRAARFAREQRNR
ncbi:MAG: polyphosphate kinase 1 [Eggerthellales bacterium]|nr:polyphosphate kinase 1 [Eggerthellales bacterium]